LLSDTWLVPTHGAGVATRVHGAGVDTRVHGADELELELDDLVTDGSHTVVVVVLCTGSSHSSSSTTTDLVVLLLELFDDDFLLLDDLVVVMVVSSQSSSSVLGGGVGGVSGSSQITGVGGSSTFGVGGGVLFFGVLQVHGFLTPLLLLGDELLPFDGKPLFPPLRRLLASQVTAKTATKRAKQMMTRMLKV